MSRFRILEVVSTRFLGLTAATTIIVVVGTCFLIVKVGLTDVDTLAKFTDAVFKTVALLIGTLWAVNRYFVERTDAPQFRVDCEVSMVHADSQTEPGLLIFRLDLVNTGKTQIEEYEHYVEIDVAKPCDTGVQLDPLYRWPREGWHEGGPIEPGSWAAVNDEVVCSSSVKAVRVFLEVSSQQLQTTWHKTFDVSRVKN